MDSSGAFADVVGAGADLVDFDVGGTGEFAVERVRREVSLE
jgi:hypothetical protein